MKDLKSIKLTQLDQVQLEERKMSYLVGGGDGDPCNCGCYYANSGGSSTNDNFTTNTGGGLTSSSCENPGCACSSQYTNVDNSSQGFNIRMNESIQGIKP